MSFSLYHVDYNALRSLLREVRVRAGLTQVEMGDALGVGQSYVSKLERGENFVDVLLFARWCQVCGIQPGTTLDGLLNVGRVPKKSLASKRGS
jgi:transcriptional regulator with XRE-family HTH domain